ncbi:hypothetical protein T440DRAFT_530497 [Plenodomus tracheiphilus IPT5]|uniref:Uncharacterized protein n=1 Tax=Plenodomus tracheiphilus IPT5 TaxID=1408161 RepID=A0A6A7B7S9_9PLEO|nr:hypothetical protein T440DRAFT_530497 [Plenodomus tracheiphilus IPT5]
MKPLKPILLAVACSQVSLAKKHKDKPPDPPIQHIATTSTRPQLGFPQGPRPSPVKPPPPGETSSSSVNNLQHHAFDKACGLEKPTAENWKRDHDKIVAWIDIQYANYRADKGYNSFFLYLLAKWAPSTAPSMGRCDLLGDCTVGTCLNFNTSQPLEDRQRAYQVMEQISGIHHLYINLYRALVEAAQYILNRSNELVTNFSSAAKVERALADEARKRKLNLAIAQALLLVVDSLVGGLISKDSAEIKATKLAVDLAVSTYVGIVGAYNSAQGSVPDVSAGVENILKAALNDLTHQSSMSVSADLRDLMLGAPLFTNQNRTVVDLIKEGDFLEPDPHLFEELRMQFERSFFASAVSDLWTGHERAYIVDANKEEERCFDDLRPFIPLCSPNHNDRVYSLQSVPPTQENDHGDDDWANIAGPAGWRAFENSKISPYNISLSDILESSLFAAENNLDDIATNLAAHKLGVTMTNKTNIGKVPGAFRLPFCRSPKGEAISSYNDKAGRNYPCMCGEMGWKDGTYSPTVDQTEKFLAQTGLMFSKDYEDACDNDHHCKRNKGIDLKAKLEAYRKPGDPPIPEKIKHPYRKCKKPFGHTWGKPYEDVNPYG